MQSILELREERVRLQEALLKEHGGSLLSLRPNFPGGDKRNLYANYAVYSLFSDLMQKLPSKLLTTLYTEEGLTFILNTQMPAFEAKAITVSLEEGHPLGRLVDIDVYSQRQPEISRGDLGQAPRKCFLCGQDAVICTRSKAHSREAVSEYFIQKVVQLLVQKDKYRLHMLEFSLLNELLRRVSLGCVTVYTNGVHLDMDFPLFLRSLRCLGEYGARLTSFDMKDFSSLRRFGLGMEAAMFKATDGINTHKGAIFSHLLLLAGLYHAQSFNELPIAISHLAQGSLSDFASKANSYGLRLYREQGVLGVRGDAAQGFPKLFEQFLPFFHESSEDLDQTMLVIAENLVDTNVLTRCGTEFTKEYRELCKVVRSGRLELNILEDFCLQHGISAGGAADMLSLTILTSIIDKHFFALKEVFES